MARKAEKRKIRKWHFEKAKSFIEVESESGCKLLSTEENFIGYTSIVEIECSCGNGFSVPLTVFINKKRQCNKCGRARYSDGKRLKYEDVKERIESYGCKLISDEYIKSNKLLDIECVCGEKYSTTYARFNEGVRQCYPCGRKERSLNDRKTHSQFVQDVMSLVGSEYDVIGEYELTAIKVLFRHNSENCSNSTFEMTPNNFLRGRRCPNCRKSHGESRIINALQELSIDFKREVVFEDCKNVHVLPFDFLVENILIEYDGEHHFYPIDFAGKGEEWAVENMKYTQQNDRIKNIYCIDKNITLLRIPYWEFKNIEQIIKKVICERDFDSKVNYENKYSKYIVDSNWNHDVYVASNSNNKEAV